ncbi:MAG: hypothetical protein FJY79_03320 [Candidatus Aminicenantes bacterium]|nr:hypothetical protein [Candidatus Aminicenantes bacterium]
MTRSRRPPFSCLFPGPRAWPGAPIPSRPAPRPGGCPDPTPGPNPRRRTSLPAPRAPRSTSRHPQLQQLSPPLRPRQLR